MAFAVRGMKLVAHPLARGRQQAYAVRVLYEGAGLRWPNCSLSSACDSRAASRMANWWTAGSGRGFASAEVNIFAHAGVLHCTSTVGRRTSQLSCSTGTGIATRVTRGTQRRSMSSGVQRFSKAVEYGHALRRAILQAEEKDGLIVLPDGTKWPELGAAPLFVRDFYSGCYEGVMQSCDAKSVQKFRRYVVIGNPGIGKSSAGCYFLYRAIRDGRTVVYVSNNHPHALIFHADGRVQAFEERLINTLDVLCDPATVLIVDGLTPPTVEAFTILITSPERERWKHLYAGVCRRLFFPVLSRDEIMRMHRTWYSEQKVEDVEAGYGRWGGIPRYVLLKTEQPDQEQLERAVRGRTLDTLASLLGAKEIELAKDDDVSDDIHLLLHFKTRGELAGGAISSRDFEYYWVERTEFASKLAADLCAALLNRLQDHPFRQLLSSGPNDPRQGVLYRQLLDASASGVLAKERTSSAP